MGWTIDREPMEVSRFAELCRRVARLCPARIPARNERIYDTFGDVQNAEGLLKVWKDASDGRKLTIEGRLETIARELGVVLPRPPVAKKVGAGKKRRTAKV
ncbi:MAG: hypothetical protein Greene041619_605 [Candidatus Peregrinibacteria bacterium Greene0416_19]|nr:MAG: hypothetical protein Greene041619_605 [Candidatus Peregrinibacteria bacterium Greene0416_19]